MTLNEKITTKPVIVFFRRDREFLDLLEHIVYQNYSDKTFHLQDLSNAMETSKRQMQRKFKALLGCTPSEYLRTYRLQKSLLLLSEGEPVREVARAVGFSSQSYFASCFRAHFGSTPSEYQRQQIRGHNCRE